MPKKPDPGSARKAKPPLHKEDLEKIAKELKAKLAKASVAAKQNLLAAHRPVPPDLPVLLTLLPKLSPLKSYYMWKRQVAGSATKATAAGTATLLYGHVTSLPTLALPGPKLLPSKHGSSFMYTSPAMLAPTSRKDSVGLEELNDSPIKRRRSIRTEPTMVLEPLPPSPPHHGLHPLPVLDRSHNRPTRQLLQRLLQALPSGSLNTPYARRGSHSAQALAKKDNPLLRTPTSRGDAYNDEEGADLLMYLATSPLVPKLYGNTPRAAVGAGPGAALAAASLGKATGQFMAPPLTPKRTAISTAKTPQNRLVPAIYGNLAVPGSALPSAGLALTPAGFNMNDYVNFFTPSPGTAAVHSLSGRVLLRTPDFNGHVQVPVRTNVDGKMIDFDKAELFGGAAEQHKD